MGKARAVYCKSFTLQEGPMIPWRTISTPEPQELRTSSAGKAVGPWEEGSESGSERSVRDFNVFKMP